VNEEKFIKRGVLSDGRHILARQSCMLCNGSGMEPKQRKLLKQGHIPRACSCVVVIPLNISWIKLPFQPGRGVVLK
jgi:hypothetical protein